MQQIYAWLDTGDGLTPLNDHSQDVAMLDEVGIQWGTDDPSEQPDPSVASVRLIDRTGRLAGDPASLAMARLVLTMSGQPTWADCDQYGAWEDCDWPISQLDQRWRPDSISAGDTLALFDGIIATGGTVTRHGDAWLIEVTASSRMILWARESRQGPAGGGRHWTDGPDARLAEINRRAAALGAPQADTTGLSLPPSVAMYDLDTYPSLLDLLHRLTAHDPRLLVWHDHASGRETSIMHTSLATPARILLDDAATPYVARDDVSRQAVPASRVIIDDESLTIPEPVTSVTIQGRRVSRDSDGLLAFDQADTVITATGLPDQLAVTEHTISRDSDAVIASETDGWTVWQPTTADRQTLAEWITTRDRHMTPESVTFDSRRLDPSDAPWAFRPEPSGPWLAIGTIYDRLTDRDGSPSASAVWTTISGTWRYQWQGGDPVIANEAMLLPVPVAPSALTWAMLDDWAAAWTQVTLTWAQMTLVSSIASTITTKELT